MPTRFNHEAAKRLRLAASLKPEVVALVTGRSVAAVFAWERGRMQPRLDVVMRMCELYGCSIDDLVIKDDPDQWMDAIRAACAASRQAQGLPPGIEDPIAIADLAELLRPT
jgi:transcriptional regulator with XRE-family HTH domain